MIDNNGDLQEYMSTTEDVKPDDEAPMAAADGKTSKVTETLTYIYGKKLRKNKIEELCSDIADISVHSPNDPRHFRNNSQLSLKSKTLYHF